MIEIVSICENDLTEMHKVLPEWLSELSISRSQIILDQIRNALSEAVDSSKKTLPTLVWRSDAPKVTDKGSGFAFAAIHGRSGTERRLGDSVTILHAGSFGDDSASRSETRNAVLPKPGNSKDQPSFIERYLEIESMLIDRGLKFAFWATDEADMPDFPSQDHHPDRNSLPSAHESASAAWNTKHLAPNKREMLFAANKRVADRCRLFGFEPLATLEYLSLSIESQATNADEPPAESNLVFERVDLASESTRSEFTALVQETYQDTLDCPRLNDFRTAGQTLAGYQAADSFAADRWYAIYPSVLDSGTSDPSPNPSGSPIGCLILASHGQTTTELVYMALIPRARQRGLGRPLIQAAIKKAVEWGTREYSSSEEAGKAVKLVLAVDEANNIARALYHRVGFEPILRETVWGKRLVGRASS